MKGKDYYLDEEARKLGKGYDNFFDAISGEQCLSLAMLVSGAMESYAKDYALACLAKAAENATVESYTPPGKWYPEYTVDKESITSIDNLI